MVAVDETAPAGVNPNVLSTSVESLYEDAQGAPDGINSSQSVNPVESGHETDQNVHETDQTVRETDHHAALVDETVSGSAPVDETDYRADNGTGADLAPVEQPVHHVSHRADEELVFVDAQAAVLDVPLAEPEDAREPVPLDPLAASPLWVTLGFERVQTACEQWLVNMSHAVTLYQGKFYQFYPST